MTERHWAWYTFRLETVTQKTYCSECDKAVPSGDQMWTSRDMRGRVAKRVCSVDCGETFDDRAMRYQAWRRERGLQR